jgi:hypothetical protein
LVEEKQWNSSSIAFAEHSVVVHAARHDPWPGRACCKAPLPDTEAVGFRAPSSTKHTACSAWQKQSSGMPRTTTCCTWLRVLYHRQVLTIYSALILVAVLAIAQPSAATWAKAAAIFCGARLGWLLWGTRAPTRQLPPAPAPPTLSESNTRFF